MYISSRCPTHQVGWQEGCKQFFTKNLSMEEMDDQSSAALLEDLWSADAMERECGWVPTASHHFLVFLFSLRKPDLFF